jgi:Raf kinase inhibitor-like YbhB/YbcL family protein
MATKVNRAATAANKKGGRPARRNKTVRLGRSDQSIDREQNQRAFRNRVKETTARNRNATAGIRTEEEVFGIPDGGRFTVARDQKKKGRPPQVATHFVLWSDAFRGGRELTKRYTGEGQGRSPSLEWRGVPSSAEELVLICEDIDAVNGPLVHWLVYRISGSQHVLPEGIPIGERVEWVQGALQGLNSFGILGYAPPLPPLFDDWHHYRFRLIALADAMTDVRPGMTREEIFRKSEGLVLEETVLMARVKRG